MESGCVSWLFLRCRSHDDRATDISWQTHDFEGIEHFDRGTSRPAIGRLKHVICLLGVTWLYSVPRESKLFWLSFSQPASAAWKVTQHCKFWGFLTLTSKILAPWSWIDDLHSERHPKMSIFRDKLCETMATLFRLSASPSQNEDWFAEKNVGKYEGRQIVFLWTTLWFVMNHYTILWMGREAQLVKLPLVYGQTRWQGGGISHI